jgi:glycosyltransferase involved in cell wall biosynthesis
MVGGRGARENTKWCSATAGQSTATTTIERVNVRVFICWTNVSGYLAACWRALSLRAGVNLKIGAFAWPPGTGSAPFSRELVADIPVQLIDRSHVNDVDHVAAIVAAHEPDVVVIPGWSMPAFCRLPQHCRLAGARFVLAMDTPRRDDWRQRLARLRLRRMLGHMDRVIVSGERAYQYARWLGCDESRLCRGMYGYDDSPLARLHARRAARAGGWPRRFLHVGRYVHDKGIDVLLAAYASYRRAVDDPWSLSCCGTGPQRRLIEAAGAEGVIDLGFVQPPLQPQVFEAHGAFVMASRYEPWGVAMAEAMAAGLPAICTEACGASVELVRPYWNGITVATDNADSLTAAMLWAHENHENLPEMGARARATATAFSAQAWADRWQRMCCQVVGEGAVVKASAIDRDGDHVRERGRREGRLVAAAAASAVAVNGAKSI